MNRYQLTLLGLSLSVGIAAIGHTLADLNPSSKTKYAQTISDRFHHQWCQQSDNETCDAIAPLTRPVLQALIYAYTTHQNHTFFTTFQTRLPCLDIYGIGIVGLQFPIPKLDTDTQACLSTEAAITP